ncbi:MAG TPA: histidine phosphatase family protein, partial [Syntrophales bacterium]|nr:histidine phosphatase family protein [Syntrophales bacterium]
MNHITIYIIRHCEPLLPRSTERIFIGQTDIPLSEAGIQHARALSLAFKDIVIEKIYSSDLIRSRHTAQLIAERHGIAVRNKPGLNEINLGTWEGLHVSEIMTNYPGEYEKRGEDIVRYRTPGGESFLDCSHRVLE